MSPKPVKNSHIQSNSRCKKIQKDYKKQTKPETQRGGVGWGLGVSVTTITNQVQSHKWGWGEEFSVYASLRPP